jgi:hypothetical protein
LDRKRAMAVAAGALASCEIPPENVKEIKAITV